MDEFQYEASKQTVRIYWQDQHVLTLSHDQARHFLERIEDADEAEAQHIMAKLTHNFKRGNEHDAKHHPRNR